MRVFVTALLLYVTTSGGNLGSSDGVVTFDLTRNLVEHGSLALSGNLLGRDENRGLDGRYYSQFGIGQSLFNAPFYVAGRMVQRALQLEIGKSDSPLKAAVTLGNGVAAAGTVATVFVLAWLLTADARASLLSAFACGAGSLLWPYARLGFNAPLAAWLLTAAVTCLYAGVTRGRPMWLAAAGVLVGLGCLTRHEFVLVAAPLSVWLAMAGSAPRSPESKPVNSLREIANRLLLYFPGVVAGVLIWAWYNAFRFGHFSAVGYTPGYSTDGYVGLLASPSGSIVIYSPIVLVGLAGLVALPRAYRSAWLLAMPALLLYLYYGSLEDWGGGRSYGPRYLVTVLPLVVVPAAAIFRSRQRRWRLAAHVILGISVLTQLPGAAFDYGRASQEWAQTASTNDLQHRRERWAASPIRLSAEAAWRAVWSSPGPHGRPSHAEPTAAAPFTFDLDFWWLHLADFHVVSRPIAWCIGLALSLSVAAASLRCWRLSERLEAPEASR